MLKLQFNLVRNIPKHLVGVEPECNENFDLGIVHTLPPCIDGEIIEWATLEEIVQDIKAYNEFIVGTLFRCHPGSQVKRLAVYQEMIERTDPTLNREQRFTHAIKMVNPTRLIATGPLELISAEIVVEDRLLGEKNTTLPASN